MIKILVSAGVLAASMGAAYSAPKCPAGSIYRVTKKICVDKSTAVRDGIIMRRDKITKVSATSPRTNALIPPAPERRHLAEATLHDPSPRDHNASAQSALPQAPVAGRTGGAWSPYGALLDPWRAGDISVSPQTRFSLQLNTQ
jgi:hypothetical protein